MENQFYQTQQSIYPKNFVFHEIIDLKGKRPLTLKDLEVKEDLNIIHEIKEVRNMQNKYISQTFQPSRKSKKFQEEIEIYLEGEPIPQNTFNPKKKNLKKKYAQNNVNNVKYNKKKNPNICPECDKIEKQSEVLCDECIQKEQNKNANQTLCIDCKEEEKNIIICNECKGKEKKAKICNECKGKEEKLAICNECKEEEKYATICNECKEGIKNDTICNECKEEEEINKGKLILCNECKEDEKIINANPTLCNECKIEEKIINTNQAFYKDYKEEEMLNKDNPIVCKECKEEEQKIINNNPSLCNECLEEEIQNIQNQNLCNECKEEENVKNANKTLCDECKNEKQFKDENLFLDRGFQRKDELNEELNNNIQIQEDDISQITIGIVNAPFLDERNNENEILNDKDRNTLIENLWKSFINKKELSENLKIAFKVLNYNDKKSIVEGLKKKKENEEQEKRIDNFISILE